MIDLELTKPHFSTKVYRSYFLYLQNFHPQIDIEQICNQSGIPYSYFKNESNWVSVVFDEAFNRICIERTGDKDFSFKVGQFTATKQGLGTIVYMMIRYSLSLTSVYQQVPRICSLVSKASKLELLENRPGFAKLRLSAQFDGLSDLEAQKLRENFENVMQNTVGHLGACPAIQGMPVATVRYYPLNDFEGQLAYEITLNYSVRRSQFALLSTAAFSLLGAAFCVFLFTRWSGESSLTTVQWLALSTPLAAGFILDLGRHFGALRASLRRAVTELEALDQRYEALQKAKEQIQAISETNLQFRLSVDEMHLGLLVLRVEPGMKFIAEPFLKNKAYDRLERSLASFGFTESLAETICRRSAAALSRAPSQAPLDLEAIVCEEEQLVLSLRAFPISKKLMGFLIEDVTQAVRAQKEIEMERAKATQSAKLAALGEMSASISHELNNPLSIISGYAQNISKYYPAEAEPAERLRLIREKILSMCTRMTRIIGGIRSFSRDGSRDPFEPRTLGDIVNETLELCAKRISNQGVELVVEGFDSPLEIRCRAVEVSQTLLNLITNACDAIANLDNKKIVVRGWQDANECGIAVQDSGPGIPQKVLEKIFQPFFTTKEVGKGTGLGLSISVNIMRQHGGSLTYEVVDGHTCFVMRFPHARLAREPKEANEAHT